jgi:hypothetical protein
MKLKIQILSVLGCKNASNRQYDLSTIILDKKSPNPTTPEFSDDEESPDDQEDNLESGYPPPAIESKLQQLLSIARGEKGPKRNFLESLFGLNKNTKKIKQDQGLPLSSYKLDKDDVDSLKEVEEYNNSIL